MKNTIVKLIDAEFENAAVRAAVKAVLVAAVAVAVHALGA